MSTGRRRWLAIAALLVVLATGSNVLSGCSRDDKKSQQDSSQSQATDASDPKTPTVGTAGKLPTIGDYIKQNNIVETEVKPGDPNAPVIVLPAVEHWENIVPPPWAYGAIINTDPAFKPDSPTVVAVLSKLTGDADPAEILKLAPNEVRNLPDFKGEDPQPSKLANFDATQISAAYTRDGKTRIIAQKTVVIPGKDGLYVLQINADGTPDQVAAMAWAMEAIDKEGSIKP